MKFKEQVMVITGGATGIGRATAELFSREGAKVYVLDINTDGSDTADELTFLKCDVANPEEVQQAVEKVWDKEQRLDLLFCNAGIHCSGTIESTSLEEFRKVLEINFSGVFFTLKAALPYMRKQKHGKIVITGSDQSKIGKTQSAIYGATKGALAQLTKSTAIDYAAYNMNINCVCPGTIKTPLVDKIIEQGDKPEEVRKFLKEAQPVQRLGKPEEVAHMVAYLCSEEAGFVNGATFSIDGGYTAQ